MTTHLQLNPSIPLNTPKGNGEAIILIDYGPEHNLMWVIILDENGEIWAFPNNEVRGCENMTLGRRFKKEG